ncbi:hypothetical protein [Pannonibacter sp. SL95]|uniref:hypothetical protein n=1 Tax=Pannonibacter sp. SL95 TaxID=2995153 RepID=UPI002273B3AE|nr:hypothetical protein [Pannonibacter sp. SL95]MCY1708525.1 hypothetical protein [Pannonibacter sp. SL95]
MKDSLLGEITDCLHRQATNYTVSLQLIEARPVQSESSSALVRRMLGFQAVLGGIETVDANRVCAEILEALQYAGFEGAGPGVEVARDSAFQALMAQLQVELRRLASASIKVERFWLQGGHPAYPVFWDFAFLFRGSDKITLFIGSASD